MSCTHADQQQCFNKIFSLTFFYCGFIHGRRYEIRAVIEAALAHPDCYRRLQVNLRTDIVRRAQEMTMFDAALQLQGMCADDSLFSDDAPDR